MSTILKTPIGLSKIDEANANRIMWHGRNGFVLISAWRSRIPDSKNADKNLLDDIKATPFAYAKIFGICHPDNSDQNSIESYQPSYLLFNHSKTQPNDFLNWEDLKAFAIEMCGKYDQDNIYIQRPDGISGFINQHGEVVSFKSSKNNYLDDEASKEKFENNTHRFTAEIKFEDMYRVSGPATYMEKMKRRQQGEIFLTD